MGIIRKKPFVCFIVEETHPFRKIKLGVFNATTPTFASRAAERKHGTFVKSLECGAYHIESSETPLAVE